MSYAISWPCTLSSPIKQKLLAISTPLKNTATLSQFAMNATTKPDDVNHHGLAYISEGIFALCFDHERVQTLNSVVISKDTWIDSQMLTVALQMGALFEEVEPIKFLWFREEQLLTLCEQHHECYKLMHFYKLQFRQQWLRSQYISQHLRSVRVAYLLHELATHTSTVLGAKPLLLLSQDQLAIMTGLSRPRVNEVLKVFNQEGIISQSRGRIYIENSNKLYRYLPSNIDSIHSSLSNTQREHEEHPSLFR
ncbi:helix-turn-helix domain-containing protein [Vibrio sp. FNV 38]|nr:helix-turn-helix domain-containing protein [Vibrio sp. FNV 38]